MVAPLVRFYIAVSVDGYIAPADGSAAWLANYDANEFGYADFIAGIGSIVMGRASYEQALGFGDWPWPGRRCVVLTSRRIAPPPGADIETHDGDVDIVVNELKRSTAGDIWLFGGAKAARPFFQANLVDQIELFVIPVLLGDGIRMFEPGLPPRGLALRTARPHPKGVVEMVYARA